MPDPAPFFGLKLVSPYSKPKPDHLDVVIVGAGLSGIGAACHLKRRCPDRTVAIIEARDAIGGTWDLFRYPGVRSDSDMQTLGYGFRPWPAATAIADGDQIRRYIRNTAKEEGVDQLVRFGRKVTDAAWSSESAVWTLTVKNDMSGEVERLTCRFLMMCGGYYSYDEAHHPDIPGLHLFRGRVVHPQFWPEGLDYRGREVVVVGSGATAMTIVPAMAKEAKRVTMLQRSPTYVVSRPTNDRLVEGLRGWTSRSTATRIARLKNATVSLLFYRFARRCPERATRYLLGRVRGVLGVDRVMKDFTPRYAPWDQRICAVRDGDLFDALRSGRADVVTDRIATFTRDGLELASGRRLKADIVVTATGLKLNLLGDVRFTIDGVPADMSRRTTYKGAMLGDVPNLVMFFGYVNASWTLKTDLVAVFACRLLNAMRRRGRDVVVPVVGTHPDVGPMIDLSSGYVARARDLLPRQGEKAPWMARQDYWRDILSLRFGRLNDGVLAFRRRGVAPAGVQPRPAAPGVLRAGRGG